MTYDPQDTIAAIASAEGSGLRGIVRVSGDKTVELLARCFESKDTARPLSELLRPVCVPGVFRLESLADRPPRSMSVPADLYLWPGVRSYTREPLAEIHTVGSPPILAAVVDTLVRLGVRPAAPGEFTLRAFLAGRIDLTQAEAVLGVIDSRDARELDIALTQLAGGLRGRLTELRERLLDLLARLEAGLDFVEEDIEFISREELTGELTAARDLVHTLAAQVLSRGHAAGAVRVVLAGPPNAGKSSLFNALLQRQGSDAAAALVSDVPGTTRDWLAGRLMISGLECKLIDTAGEEDPHAEEISAQAQQARHEQLAGAHITLLCRDIAHLSSEPRDVADPRKILVWTKADAVAPRNSPSVSDGIRTSALTRQGLDELLAAIRAAASGVERAAEGVVAATAIRSSASIRLAGEALDRALSQVGREELVASEVRVALTEIGQVVGAVYTDDLLDRIFSRFCIGK